MTHYPRDMQEESASHGSSMRGALIPGAEPQSVAVGPVGVLVLHGFTGNPSTMRPLADAIVRHGYSLELPRLLGHGTVIDDMLETKFSDWSGEVESAYSALAGRCDSVVVVGLSMGAMLTCWIAARHPEVAGIVCINPMVAPQEPLMVEMIQQMLDAGELIAPGVGSDLADPESHESAYLGTPLKPVLTLFEAIDELQDDLASIRCPLLLITSRNDHVVPPSNSDHLAAAVSGPVKRIYLDRSFHVATLDYDKDEIAAEVIAFIESVTGSVSGP